MSFYIIEDDDGNTMDYNGYFNCPISKTELFDEPNEPAKFAEELGGHVVKLVEAPAKIVVSEEEAKMLETAKHNPTLRPSFMITEYSNSHKGYILGNDLEDRLMCAYVNGYTVAKETLYNVKVPYTDDSYFYKVDDDVCNAGDSFSVNLDDDTSRFTEAEIEHYSLQDCEKIWCDSDEV